MKLRPVIFWLHLTAGLTAGLVIGMMSFTGAMLAFEKEIIAWAERDARKIAVPANAQRIPLDELLARVRDKQPGERPSAITVEADPGAAVLIGFGRTNAFYVNPYTGEVREPAAKRTRQFMQVMINWHRF